MITFPEIPIGQRVRLIKMEDPYPIESGTLGTIVKFDGIGNYIVNWDNGRILSLIPEEDQFEFID